MHLLFLFHITQSATRTFTQPKMPQPAHKSNHATAYIFLGLLVVGAVIAVIVLTSTHKSKGSSSSSSPPSPKAAPPSPTGTNITDGTYFLTWTNPGSKTKYLLSNQSKVPKGKMIHEIYTMFGSETYPAWETEPFLTNGANPDAALVSRAAIKFTPAKEPSLKGWYNAEQASTGQQLVLTLGSWYTPKSLFETTGCSTYVTFGTKVASGVDVGRLYFAPMDIPVNKTAGQVQLQVILKVAYDLHEHNHFHPKKCDMAAQATGNLVMGANVASDWADFSLGDVPHAYFVKGFRFSDSNAATATFGLQKVT